MTPPAPLTDPAAFAERIAAADRRALARAITLIESTRPEHRAQAVALLAALRERQMGAADGRGREALRIGLSGSPGVGKSTFIESFGLRLTAEGLRVAVLAVDPSSVRSGGSILGDKTRMERLARARGTFIRPSPSRAALGGVARRTREAVSLCEMAGFDVVLIETVGVGQSETMVAEMSDLFVLLIAPGGGDELQGVKRGIMEIADLILVNKADGELKPTARRTRADYAAALRLLRKRRQDPPGYPRAICVSAISGDGLTEAWTAMRSLADWRKSAGIWAARRTEQAVHWFEEEVRAGLLERLTRDGATRAEMARLGAEVAAGRIAPAAAARTLLAGFDASR